MKGDCIYPKGKVAGVLGEDLYRRADFAHAKTDDLKSAVILLEQGRARGLRGTLEKNRADFSALSQQTPTLYKRDQTATILFG